MTKDFIPLPERQRRLAVMGVMLALFLAALSQTVVATAMPGIIADLGGFDRYTWASTAYLVASTVAIPIAGRLADLYGRRVFFMLGIAVFVLGSVPAGMSQSMSQLVACRVVQGIGGGVIVITCMAAIADLFPPGERGRFQGLTGLVYGMAAVIGPALGGFITDHLSWPWIFVLKVPAGLAVLFLIARTFPPVRPRTRDRGLDYAGMAALVLAVAPVLVALSRSGLEGGGDPLQTVGLLVFGLAMAAVFVAIESRSASPIMPLTIYAERTVAVGAAAMFLSGFVMYGSVLFVPLFFQGVLGASATSSGAFLTPLVLAVVLGAVLSGRTLSRHGGRYRAQGLLGTAFMAAGAWLLSTMDETASFARAVAYIVVMGLGLGAIMPVFNTAVQNSVPYGFVGAATAALQFHRLVGGTLGLAVMGAAMTRGFSRRIEETLADSVRAALPPGRLDALKENPQALMDPSAADALKAGLAEPGADGARLAEMLLDALYAALSGAVGDALTLGAAAAALSVLAALFIRMRGDTAAARDERFRP